MLTRKALNHFFEFHRGIVNITLHIIGFAGIFYSLYKLDWLLFAVFLVIVEAGHIYNHIVGIKKYDLRPGVLFWRVLIFLAVVLSFYLLARFYIN